MQIPNNLHIVKEQREDFIWRNLYPESESLFEGKDIFTHYDCYHFSLLPTDNHQTTIFRIAPKLEIISGTTILFIGEIPLHYTIIDIGNEYGLVQLVKVALFLAHNEFIKTFNERAYSDNIEKFRPEFSNEMLDLLIFRLVHPFS